MRLTASNIHAYKNAKPRLNQDTNPTREEREKKRWESNLSQPNSRKGGLLEKKPTEHLGPYHPYKLLSLNSP